MSVNSHFSSIIKAVGRYESLLTGVSEEKFTQTPIDGSWSYSETFSHIFQSNLVSLFSIEKCLIGTGTFSEKSTPWQVSLILFFGRFPPGKYKAPAQIASMVKTLSREEAANLIVKFKNRLIELKGKVDRADKNQRVKHPRLGLLNARQWFRFIEIHTIHHTRQLTRISNLHPPRDQSSSSSKITS
ncbi:DinB family protein [Daejeonella sp.]|uniref:DinB family protein n=1 Tax=Daejeonella sp. TaxID=2805397 RepID=UPI003983A0F0